LPTNLFLCLFRKSSSTACPSILAIAGKLFIIRLNPGLPALWQDVINAVLLIGNPPDDLSCEELFEEVIYRRVQFVGLGISMRDASNVSSRR